MPIQKPNFDLNAEYVQIALDLELPEVESEGVSVEEARLRSEAARKMAMGRPISLVCNRVIFMSRA